MIIEQRNGKFYCPKHGEIVIFSSASMPGNGRGQLPLCIKCKDLIERKICIDCEEHPATVDFALSAVEAMQGMTDPICRCCQVKRLEAVIKNVTENRDKAAGELLVAPCVKFKTIEVVQ